MKTQSTLLLALLFIPFFLSAQCIVNAGPDTTFCAPNFSTDTLYIGSGISVRNGTPPYSYAWSTSYLHPRLGLQTASQYLNDSSLANPILIDYGWDPMDTLGQNTQPFVLQVTDAMGQTCSDTLNISYTQWLPNLDDCRFMIPQGMTVQLRPNVGGGLTPLTYAWSPNHALNDSTLASPSATPDSNMVYHVTVTDQAGCTFQNSCTIFMNPSSIAPEQQAGFFSISPNPVQHTAFIQLEHIPFQHTFLELIDLQGRKVLAKEFYADRMEISTASLPNGTYFCQIKKDQQVLSTQKLVVIKE